MLWRRLAAALALSTTVLLAGLRTSPAPAPGDVGIVLPPDARARFDRKLRGGGLAPYGFPDEAAAFYANSRTGPLLTRGPGRTTGARPINPAAYLPAIEQMRDMPRYSTARGALLPSARASGASLVDEVNLIGPWTPLGPTNQGGRTRALLIDPVNPAIMYAGGVAGGVWKSTDAGDHWLPLTDLMANLAVVTLAFDPSDSDTIYAGTGEGFGNVDAVRGAGIFVSTDAGASWTQLPATNTSVFHYTMKVLVSPRQPQRLWAATRVGLYRSTDAGGSWTQVVNGAAVGGCTDMAMQTGGPSGFVFVSCGRGTAQGTVYRGEDTDTSTFASVLSLAGQGRSSIAVAPSDEAIVYIMAAQRNNGGGPGTYGLHGIYRSTTHGENGSFVTRRQGTVDPTDVGTRINQLLLSNPVIALLQECGYGPTSQYLNQGWYDNVLAVDPLDPNRVWAGGIDLWRSDDAGTTWGVANYWWFTKGVSPQYAHADQHAIVFHPDYDGGANRVMFAASDGGVARIDNARAPVGTTLGHLCGTPVAGAAPWIDRSNGYVTTQFYDGVPYPAGEAFFGGLQDNGTMRGAAGNTAWGVLAGGDGGYVAIDTLGDAVPGNDILFLENTGNSMKRSTDGGQSFTDVTAGIDDAGMLFIAPFTMNEGQRQQMWTGGFSLWRSTDHATTWTRATGPGATCGSGSVSAIAVHPADGNRVLVGMSDGCYHYNHSALTAPDTGSWPGGTYIASGVGQGLGLISWMTWHPTDFDVAYATISAFGVPNLLKTTDGGVTWSPSVGSGATALPQIPALSVAVNPVNPSHVHVGTDLGVFTSLDAGASWLLEASGFPNTPVEALKFDSGASPRLFAFTHGRGAFSVGTTCPLITVTPSGLPAGLVGTAYAQTLTASGGLAPYTFAVAAGTLPTGLALGTTGQVSGTASTSGTFTFTARATDANDCIGTREYTVVISRQPSTTTVTFEGGPYTYRGAPFTATASATGTGLSQSVPVSYSGDCTNVTSTNGCTASATFAATTTYDGSTGSASITIAPAPVHTTAHAASASSGDTSVVLHATVTSATAPVTTGAVTFTVHQGSTVLGSTAPVGVTSGTATTAFAIPDGTPVGAYTITPAYTPGANFVADTVTTATLTISATCGAIVIGPASLPNGAFAATYTQALTASGGQEPYTFTLVGGTLPPGLTLAAGLISGTPTTAALAAFSVQAVDANGCVGGRDYTVDVARAASTTQVAFEPGPYVYRGTTFTATAVATGAGGLSMPLPVSTTGNCTDVGMPGGCTATASFAGSATHLPSSGSSSLTITPATTTISVTSTTAPWGATSVLLTAAVASPTATVNEGRVTFVLRQGQSPIGTAVTSDPVSDGVAQATFAVPVGTRPGTYGIEARYQPGANFVTAPLALGTLTIVEPTDPQPPTALAVDRIAGGRVRFRWTPAEVGPAPTTYVLEGGVAPGQALATLSTGHVSPVLDVALAPGTYYARVYAMTGTARSAASNEVAIYVSDAVAPAMPLGFTGAVNGTTLDLAWKDSFAGGLPVGVALEVSGDFVGTIPLPGGERARFPGVPGGVYTLRLRATNGAGASEPTPPVTVSLPSACTGAPSPPERLLAYRVGSTITVLWDPPATGPAASSYVLRVSGSFTANLPMTTREISAPAASGTYTVRVVAVNDCGESAATLPQTVVVP